jgi:hypothetical protein
MNPTNTAIPTNRERFQAVLADAYRDLFANDPEYAYSARLTTPDALAAKMTIGLANGSANLDGAGIRRACKACGVRQTYKALRPFLCATVTPEVR